MAAEKNNGFSYYITAIINVITQYFLLIFAVFGQVFNSFFHGIFVAIRGVYDILYSTVIGAYHAIHTILKKIMFDKFYEAVLKPPFDFIFYVYKYSIRPLVEKLWNTLMENDIYKYIAAFLVYLAGVIYANLPAAAAPAATAAPAAKGTPAAIASALVAIRALYSGIFSVGRALFILLAGIFFIIMKSDSLDAPEMGHYHHELRFLPIFKLLVASAIFVHSASRIFWPAIYYVSVLFALPAIMIISKNNEELRKKMFIIFGAAFAVPTVLVAAKFAIPQIITAFSDVIQYISMGAKAGGDFPAFMKAVNTPAKKGGDFIQRVLENLRGIGEHFSSVLSMELVQTLYILASSIGFIGLIYYMYYFNNDKNIYLFMTVAFVLFALPTIQTILKNNETIQHNVAKLSLIVGSVIALFLMHTTHKFMETSDKFNILNEQQGDKTIFDILFVFFSAILVFYVNLKLLSPGFDGNTDMMNFFIFIHFMFIVGMLVYSVMFKIKLRNRLDTAPDQAAIQNAKDETPTTDARFPIVD